MRKSMRVSTGKKLIGNLRAGMLRLVRIAPMPCDISSSCVASIPCDIPSPRVAPIPCDIASSRVAPMRSVILASCAILACCLALAGCGGASGGATPGDEGGNQSGQQGMTLVNRVLDQPEDSYWEMWHMAYEPAEKTGFGVTCRYGVRDTDKTLLCYTIEGYDPEKIKLILPEEVPADAVCLAVDAVTDELAAVCFRGEGQNRAALFNKWGRTVWSGAIDTSHFPEEDFTWLCDSEGNQLIWDGKAKELSAYKGNGEEIGLILSCGERENVTSLLHDEDGNILYATVDYDGNGTRLYRYDFAGKKSELLMQDLKNVYQFYGMKDGKLLYSTGWNQLLWGAIGESGVTMLLNLQTENILGLAHVLMGKNGELYLYTADQEGETVYGYSREEPDGDKIVICDFASMNHYVEKHAKRLGRESGIRYVYKDATPSAGSASFETVWNRLMAELAAGKGADIYLMDSYSWDRILTLYDKGVLADMTTMVPEEVRDQIFQGILESGIVDGKLIALATQGTLTYCATSAAYDLGEHYTTKDILDLLDRLEAEGREPEGLFYGGSLDTGMQGNMSTSTSRNFGRLVIMGLENSEFIDFEAKTCNFEDPEFARILEVCKKYGENKPEFSNLYMQDYMRTGRILGWTGWAHSPTAVARDYYNLGYNTFRMNNFPNQKEGRAYWDSASLVLVNANSSHQEEIRALLEELWDYENQRMMEDEYIPVRKDVLRGRITTNYVWSYHESGPGGFAGEIRWDEEHDYRDDFVDLFETAIIEPREYAAIKAIVEEEADTYFNGAKPVEEVCRIIQNRVQLYLKEMD